MSNSEDSFKRPVQAPAPAKSIQLPQYLYIGSILYQYRIYLSFHELIRWNHTMEYPQDEHLLITVPGGDNLKQSIKRKTSEVPTPRILGVRYGRCREAFHNHIHIEEDTSQKKQKLIAEPCTCSQNGICLACDEKYQMFPNSDIRDSHLMNMLKSTIVGNASSRYPDSDMSKSESHRSRSISSKSSSRTTLSSRSPSLERDDQIGGVSLQTPELPIEQQIQHMSHHIVPDDDSRGIQYFDTHDSLECVNPLSDRPYLLIPDSEVGASTLQEQNPPTCTVIDVYHSPDDPDEVDRVSTTSHSTNNTPSRTSQDAESSIMDLDDPSTEGDKSSDSKSLSETSDLSEKGMRPSRRTRLERLIKDDVLRSSPPEIAEYVYQAVKGKLECASLDDIPQRDANGELSLLELIELQALTSVTSSPKGFQETYSCPSKIGPQGMINASPTIISHSPSSSTSTSGITPLAPGNSQTEGASSSLGGLSHESPTSFQKSDKGSDPQNKAQKSNGKSAPHSNLQQQLRCPFNAMKPAIFCANPDTKQKYRVCAGPGWNTVSHLKGHLKTHHTKEENLPNALQCSRCQNEFLNQDDLRAHDEDVDCPITCPICKDVFATKEMRQQHRKQAHQDDLRDALYMEIGQAGWKAMNENLKHYTEALKKGKGKTPIKPELEQWVEANRTRFETGRSPKAKASAKLELGQWYIIFTTLKRHDTIIPPHPFYDHVIPHGDLAEEKILLISDALMAGRIQYGMFPPEEISTIEDEAQRADRYYQSYYRSLIQEALRMAAKTKLSDHVDEPSHSQYETSVPLAGPSSHEFHNSDYNLQNTLPGSRQHSAYGHDALPGMSSYLPNIQDHDGSMSMSMANASSMNTELWMGQFSDQNLSLDLEAEFSHFPSSTSDSRTDLSSAYRADWPGHPGGG